MKIIENAVPRPLFEFAKLETETLDWMYLESTHSNTAKGDLKSYSFAANMFTNGEHGNSQTYLWVAIFYILLDRFDISYDDLDTLLRIRHGLITNVGEHYEHGTHIDFERPHYTMLLYLDTIEDGGETTFYNERRNLKYKQQEEQLEREELTLEQKVKAVENRCALFDGFQFHNSSTPMDKPKRLAVNFNFTLKKGLTNIAD